MNVAGKAVWIMVGTRPEVIKQASVYEACRRLLGPDEVALVGTGQHRELLEQALAHFGIELAHNIDTMRINQRLTESSAVIMAGMDELLADGGPRVIVVQGDTTSATTAAWAGFQHGVPVAHNEAGLRSFDLAQPFPEEGNRKVISAIATLHFAPTEMARQALLAEGVPDGHIHVTGNPGIDSFRAALEMPQSDRVLGIIAEAEAAGGRLVVMTAHRRENRGAAIEEWFSTLAGFLELNPDLHLVYPIHLNDAGRAPAERHLEGIPGTQLLAPLAYADTCHLLERSAFVITDSGGIQEEAATLGLPCIVCRNATERMEAVEAGSTRLAGTSSASLFEALVWAQSESKRSHIKQLRTLFGDGKSGERIAHIIASRLT